MKEIIKGGGEMGLYAAARLTCQRNIASAKTRDGDGDGEGRRRRRRETETGDGDGDGDGIRAEEDRGRWK